MGRSNEYKQISLFAISLQDANQILTNLEYIYNIVTLIGAGIGERATRLNIEIRKDVDLNKRFCIRHDYVSTIFSDTNHHRADEKIVFCRDCGLCR